ncbi:sugar transferase [Rhodococcus sp. 1168]|uniref:sugar transferase n=1 Tax=Rhodococcus sp. 1168 TaxID=2018041 RepID=UPI000A0AD808|nr:sugar transferase [Rhodococcus sp. 1168]ORI13490.1 UDP-phosphate galactose phosphotransferase [Rhodococcus sp. 1168]
MTTASRRTVLGAHRPRPRTTTTSTARHATGIVPIPSDTPSRLISRISAHVDLYALAGDLIVLLLVCWFVRIDYPVPAALMLVSAMAVMGGYRTHLTLSVLDTLPRTAMASVLASVGTQLVLASRTELMDAIELTVVTLAAVILSRNLTYGAERFLRRKLTRRHRTVIVGSGSISSMLADSMVAERSCGLELIGVLDDSPQIMTDKRSVAVLPLRGRLNRFLTTEHVDTVVLAFSTIRDSDMLSILRTCDRIDCEIFVVPRLWEMTAVSGDMDRIGAIPLTRVRRAAHRSLTWGVKLWTSRVLSAALLLLLSPLLLATAAAVYFSDRSAPILFRQERIGLDDRKFELLKFRTMKPTSEDESATNWCIADDTRVGRLGRIMRATSLDELPQLWNVVRGDMTLVGPRPERPYFVAKFCGTIPNYSARHRVPAGLTGWAAVNGFRGDTSVEERARYDNYYIENWGLWFDVKIMLRTLSAVLMMKGR